MKVTDVFVHRPVLASVVSLLILVIGLRAITLLDVREYPKTLNTVVTVTTSYPGAGSELVKGFITTPLQQAIAEANGIDYLFSTSTQGRSTIEAHMVLDYDPNDAVSEIQAKVASQRNVLPADAEDPVITSTTGDSTALMYIAFFSKTMTPSQITDYLLRVVQPKLQALPGVAKAELIGNKTYAMRVWLDPGRMSALGVTAQDVSRVLAENNYLAAVGQTKDRYVSIDLSATTDVSQVEDFEDLVVRREGDTLVRLRDVASTELGSETYDSLSWYKREPAVYVGVEPSPGANPLTVAQRVNGIMPELRGLMPSGLEVHIPYDASIYIQESIEEVFATLAEAMVIVLVVIFLSLGSLRAALVPGVAVPLSLIGGAFLMLALGYSLNLLTLLAMVLAIGLVVDDAIIVVENVHRHVEAGESRKDAALRGARELALPIIAMTTTLVAVYAPIGFMGGLVGTLFTEFAFTLAGAVLISGVVALTLSPMLSGKVLKAKGAEGRFEHAVSDFFNGLASRYQRTLHASLDYVPVTVVFGAVIFASIYFMFVTSRSELAPVEDRSILFFQSTAPQTATIEYDEIYTRQILDVFESIPEYDDGFFLLGLGGDPSTIFGGFKMPPVNQRDRSQMQIQPELQEKLNRIAGLQTAVFQRPSLPGAGGGLPVQFVMTSDAPYEEMDAVADELLARANRSGQFQFMKKSIDFNRPKTTLVVNRNLAGDLGISMAEIGRDLSALLGGSYVNRFSLEGRSYKVIPQAAREFRDSTDIFDDHYLRSASGELVPMSSLVRFEQTVEPSERTQFQQLNSITLEGVMAPGVALGDALAYLEAISAEVFPRGYSFDFSGLSRQFAQQGTALIVTFFLSLLVIYLVLAAQFESWRNPLIILVSVPMSIAGALVFITLGLSTVNIYTQVGLITLIGLIAKNGILIVEFADQLQVEEGLDKRAAVERAAAIRLRPILMTTVAMLVAMIPLLRAVGPGAVSRFDIGLVITSGLGIGTLFTLFVVPAFYVLLASERGEAAPGRTGAEVHRGSPA